MELLVERHETGVRYRHLFEKCVPLVEFGTERVSIMSGGLTVEYPPKSVYLEEYAQLVEATQLVEVRSVRKEAVFVALDQPVGFQLCERFAHRCSRDTVEMGKAFLAQSFRGRDLTGHQIVSD